MSLHRLPQPLAAAVGVIADGFVGEPPDALHPVRLFGRAMEALERSDYGDSRTLGAVHLAMGSGLGWVAGGLMRSTATATTVAVAGRSLRELATDVARALEAGDTERARTLLPGLVGRDVSQLDSDEMARAVVESVAENTVDALVAPACWAAVGGAPGVLAYRAVNTLDAMVGHRDDRYRRFGWASARLDDVMAFVPARVTAALVVAVRPRAAGAVWRAVRTQARAHPSPNGGVAEAAFAAALGLRLGGTNRYGDLVEERPVLGDGRRPEPADVARAVHLSRHVATALVGCLGAVGLARLRRRSRRVADSGAGQAVADRFSDGEGTR